MEEDDPLAPVVSAIRRAFPQRPESPTYDSVLAVLLEEMSFRAVARALELAWCIDRTTALHDTYGLGSQPAPLIEDARQRLIEAGLPRDGLA